MFKNLTLSTRHDGPASCAGAPAPIFIPNQSCDDQEVTWLLCS
jgi:hypothetical protein